MNLQTLEGQYLGQIFQSKHNFEPQSYAKIITTGTASRKSLKLRFYYPPRPAPPHSLGCLWEQWRKNTEEEVTPLV